MQISKCPMIICFCWCVFKPAGETAKKVLSSVIWNPLLIERNLSQIRPLDIKRKKVRAVCPYLLFRSSNLFRFHVLVAKYIYVIEISILLLCIILEWETIVENTIYKRGESLDVFSLKKTHKVSYCTCFDRHVDRIKRIERKEKLWELQKKKKKQT